MNEYPRPQLKRDSFFSLNGTWELKGKTIEVPFPPQSTLACYDGQITDTLTYSRSFRLPDNFRGEKQRVRLHLGAVDQVAEVQINGTPVARHEGGYLPFFADVTDVLKSGINQISVRAVDTLSHDYPYGKQSKKRGGMWYTPVSGIWQSVWMEAVSENPIERIKIEPDLEGIELGVGSHGKPCRVEIPGVLTRTIESGRMTRIDIPSPVLWTPDNPHLYRLILSTDDDRVESYFALRTIETGIVGNVVRILLNGKPIFINGVLDQGYFSDGLYLPASPSEYEKDILRMKALGFNLLRKHAKVEPEAFYYACDRLGMLVMQDMVNSGSYSFLWDTALPNLGFTRRGDRCVDPDADPAKTFFTHHCIDTLRHLRNHPCVIAYTIFNEGWGQFNADEHYRILKSLDPSRLFDATSGWFAQKKSDFDSRHVYFKNKRLVSSGEVPLLLSECGGYARPIAGHMFNEQNKYGYGTADTENALTAKIEQLWKEMIFPSLADGLCGVIYTQLSDVEDEINGLYTYDREICKVDAERIRRLCEESQRRLDTMNR